MRRTTSGIVSLVIAKQEKKFKLQTCVGKVMASIFWESEGISLVEF